MVNELRFNNKIKIKNLRKFASSAQIRDQIFAAGEDTRSV